MINFDKITRENIKNINLYCNFIITIFKKIKTKHFNIFSLGFSQIQKPAIKTHSTVT